MGQGFYFNMPSEVMARRAQNTFMVLVMRRFKRRVHTLGITRTTSGRYISGVDVCGSPDARIEALRKAVEKDVNNGL